MSTQPEPANPTEQADQSLPGANSPEMALPEIPPANPWAMEGVDHRLTPLQYHYLTLLRHMVSVKDEYQAGPEAEPWLLAALNKSIYSTLRDCMEANVGDDARRLLHPEQQVG